jgi:hypothetical protein
LSTFKTPQELYDAFIAELQSQAPDLTDTNEGSTIDVIGGATAAAVNEISALVIDGFRKTFFNTANGPEVTLGADELEQLAVDHFGEAFRRPAAAKATGTVTFSRANTGAGNVTIGIGTIVKTAPNSSGVSQRFEVLAEVILAGTSINASVRALVAGAAGNVSAGTVSIIETTLTDPTVVVTNADAFGDGTETATDSEYRETIRNLIETLRGATKAAIESAALTVAGVENATAFEELIYVKQWNIAAGTVSGEYFGIPRAKLYIADANGIASAPLLASVSAAIEPVRACGVQVQVISAVALSQNWTAVVTLNPAGPNFSTFQTNTQMIKDTMTKYIQDLPIGTGFVRADANAAMLALWGPAGTNDLTAFTTSAPGGDVAGIANQKLIPGTMST